MAALLSDLNPASQPTICNDMNPGAALECLALPNSPIHSSWASRWDIEKVSSKYPSPVLLGQWLSRPDHTPTYNQAALITALIAGDLSPASLLSIVMPLVPMRSSSSILRLWVPRKHNTLGQPILRASVPSKCRGTFSSRCVARNQTPAACLSLFRLKWWWRAI